MPFLNKIFSIPAAVLWTAVVFYACLMPSGDVPKVPWLAFPGADKIMHVILFGTLSGLYWMAFSAISGSALTLKRSLLVAAGVTDIGILIEILQWAMPLGRSFEWLDILVNCLAALAVAMALYARYGKESSNNF